MGQLKEITDSVFGSNDRMAKGDQTLMAAMTCLHDIRKISSNNPDNYIFAGELERARKPKHEGKLKIAKIVYEELLLKASEINNPEFQDKFKRVKDLFAEEIRMISPSSSTNHRSSSQVVRGQQTHGRT